MVHDHVCSWKCVRLIDNPLRRLLHNPEKLLQPYVRPGMTVLDVGCGMGLFSIGMARLVGPEGKVLSVDVQPEMLDLLKRRAEKAGLRARIHPHLCGPRDLGLSERLDFALAFWMVHELPDCHQFFRQLRALIQNQGRMLIAEPRIHVSRGSFAESLRAAREEGWAPDAEPEVRGSWSALLRPAERETE
jgi:cyclopropane fatty-acyl-phospholipid synthase-like methyltransferase